jgi:hypothetical protein
VRQCDARTAAAKIIPSRKPVVFREVALTVPRNIPAQAGQRIWITIGIILLAAACLTVVMAGNGPAPESHMFWFW